LKDSYQYCGREFTREDIQQINRLIETNPDSNRYRLSLKVCELLGWYRIDNKAKDMSCRVAMLRMEKDGLIQLPPPVCQSPNGRRTPKLTQLSQPGFPIETPVGKLGALEVIVVKTTKQSRIWNEHIERYHYLGYQPLPGAQIRYLIYCEMGLLAATGFGAAAWMCKDRDTWIGWTHSQRKNNLHLLVNNSRFLILPWVKSKNLASKILSMIAHRIREDWFSLYAYRPVLMETFVDETRFHGTCYKAANWIEVGKSKGRGKLGGNTPTLPPKIIFLLPLIPNFRNSLIPF
jgi:hypothetical protein